MSISQYSSKPSSLPCMNNVGDDNCHDDDNHNCALVVPNGPPMRNHLGNLANALPGDKIDPEILIGASAASVDDLSESASIGRDHIPVYSDIFMANSIVSALETLEVI